MNWAYKLPFGDTQRTKSKPLVVLLQRSYFTRFTRKNQVFVTGSKPAVFAGKIPRQREWLQHLRQDRAINPIAVARRFQSKYEESGYGSYSKVAEYFAPTGMIPRASGSKQN